eukprot:TRINITY_DN6302_c0_g1_i1.p1 TRINITY_DN6302_c0_g1~~TRINITY_DN6302_c0_g1_i1.p1  ORF type:complete len:197 (+),score=33.66 TRINITY_DN6302_c0_g1_i1:28-618(+)
MEGYDPQREEARIMAHAEKFAQRKASGRVTQVVTPKHEPVAQPGRVVRVIWVDRDTGNNKDTIQVELDRLGRIPAEFLKMNWGVTNLYWKDSELLVRSLDDGFSATPVPATSNHVFLFADNNPTPVRGSSGSFQATQVQETPVLVEEFVIPAPVRVPSANSTPISAAPTRKINFCSNCGAKCNGGRFCASCGSPLV